jgi:TonB family protein
MYYLLLSAIALVLFYLFYKWLLSRDTLHRFNRVVLLVVLVLSVVLPAVHLDLGTRAADFAQLLEELVVTPADEAYPQPAASPKPSPEGKGFMSPLLQEGRGEATLLLILYLAGVAFFLVRLGVGVVRNARLGRRGSERLDDGTRLVLHDGRYAPFSWMHTIVVSRRDYDANAPMILAHEREHIRLGHSWDILLCQLCTAFQWFNPAAWLVGRELRAVHEYEADEAMLRSGTDARHYQMKLIETALGARFNSIANNFTNCSTKKRILMMMKKQTSPWARLKVLYVLPVAALVLLAASCNNAKEEADAQKVSEAVEADPLFVVDGNVVSVDVYKSLKPEDIDHVDVLKGEAATSVWGTRGANGVVQVTTKKAAAPSAEDNSDVFNVVEKMPEFEGGMNGMMSFLQKNIKYPEEAIKNGTQGRVVVQFVVNKDGSITDANVVKSVSPELDAEALRVVKSMPKWTPGEQRGEKVRVQFTLPVQFKLPKAEDK